LGIIEGLFNDWFAISRRERVSDGQGGWPVGWASVGLVRGRIRPATAAEIESAAQQQRQITHVLYVLPVAGVARGDRVASSDLTLTVDVQGVRDPSHAGHHWEVDCVEVQREVASETGT
jgi:SPP1 family predicted phage head-tail adaptor